jgi:hypothetical protein
VSVDVTLNGTEFTLPTRGEVDWGDAVTSYLQAIPAAIAAGGAGFTTAGAGLTASGATVNVAAADDSITVNVDSIQLKSAYKLKLDNFVYLTTSASVADIQAALDTGGTVRLAPGTYALGTTTLNLNGNAALEGSGEDETILTYTGTGSALQINSGTGTTTLNASVRFLTLDGTNAGSGGYYGITLGQSSVSPMTGSGLFMGLTIKRFQVAGLRIVVSAVATFVRCSFQSNDDGVWATNDFSNGVTGQSFIACRFVDNLQRGAFLEQYDTVSFTNTCQFENNGKEGLLVQHPGGATAVTRNLLVTGNYFEGNGTAGAYSDLRFDNASTQSHQNCKVTANRFQDANADGNIYFGKGSFLEEDNEFSPTGVTNVIALSSTVCFLHGRSIKDPTTYYTLGANAPATFERRGGNGTMVEYTNRAGTWTVSRMTLAIGTNTFSQSLSGDTAQRLPTADAHADDDEFDSGTTISTSWTVDGGRVATAIDPYANFTTAGAWRSSHNSMRKSWLMVQPTATGTYIEGLHKAVTVGSDKLVWTKLSFNRRNTSVADNDCAIGFGLAATSGGLPDANNRVSFYLTESDAGDLATQYNSVSGGVATTVEWGYGAGTAVGLLIDTCHMAIQKIGTTIHYWLSPNGLNWVHIGTTTYTGSALDRACIFFANNSTTTPGNMIMGVDFIRFKDSATYLP